MSRKTFPPRETSQVAKSVEERMFSRATFVESRCLEVFPCLDL